MEKSCNICKTTMIPVFTGKILEKYTVQYFACPDCGYICTENPFWLNEAYKKPINITDTGILGRNIFLSKITACVLFIFFNKKIKCLDYGGGYGILTRLMRDIGFDYYWYDPFARNLFAQGFEYKRNSREIDVITSFENFEHFSNPVENIDRIFSISKNILFTTELLPEPVPKLEQWWYYGLEHGQHVSFYSKETLQTIAKKYGIYYYSFGNFHFFTPKKINKLLWLVVCKFSINFIFPIICLKMKSKTVTDMIYLVETMKR